MKMNKKGQLFKIIFSVVIIGVLLWLAFTQWIPGIANAGKNVGDILASDFDGDNKANGYPSELNDPCGCGPDNVKKTIGSKEYCISEFDVACVCSAAQNLADKEEEGRHFFESAGKCAYTDDGCKYLRIQDPDFMEKVAAGEITCGTS